MQLRFLLKSILIASLFLIISLLIIQYTNRLLNKKDDKDALYIWGDSQTYQGLDLKLLKDELGCNVYSAAQHGAGVYDFLVFAENVPEKSKVIIGLSQFILLRSKSSDFSRSGLSLGGLFRLLKNNYSLSETYNVVMNNISLKNDLFYEKSYLFEGCKNEDTFNLFKFYSNFYSKPPKSFFDKIKLLNRGFETLKQKGCKIEIINFPISSLLKNKIRFMKVFKSTNKVINRFMNLNSTDKILFKNIDSENFYDLTHCNTLGAKKITVDLIKNLKIKSFI